MKKIFLPLWLCLLWFSGFAQTVPVGTPVLEDYLRRKQLLGEVDSASSWMIRPLHPARAYGVPHGFDLDGSVVDFDSSTVHSRLGKDGKGKFLIMPGVYRAQFNSDYAFGANDGVMVPNRGFQQVISPGLYLEYGKFSLQLQPEVVIAQNQEYSGLPIEHHNTLLFYYEYMNRIDLPERFGKGSYSAVFPGQSSLRFNWREYSVGVSTENLWWGPGRRNSLLMSNNAPGFLHATFNTTKPVRTKIGSFEGQWIAGLLQGSGYPPPLSEYTGQENPIYIPKPENDTRYLTGLTLVYQPKWVPGLFLGYSSVSNLYTADMDDISDWLPLFNGRKGPQNVFDPVRNKRQQFSSMFFRWLSPKGHFEFYGEYGTRGNYRILEDFLNRPESGRAFTFGFAHLTKLKTQGRYIETSFEMTQTGQTVRDDIRNLRTWYIHDRVRHGYTNQGQVLGVGNGPGSNQIYAGIAWVEGLKKLGFQFERIVYNNDFYNYFWEGVKDIRRKYVDLAFTLAPEWKFGNLLLSGKFQYVSTLNYKWYIYLENEAEMYIVPGNDRGNFVAQAGLTYFFR